MKKEEKHKRLKELGTEAWQIELMERFKNIDPRALEVIGEVIRKERADLIRRDHAMEIVKQAIDVALDFTDILIVAIANVDDTGLAGVYRELKDKKRTELYERFGLSNLTNRKK